MEARGYKPTSTSQFTVKRVGELRSSSKGDPFVECDTDVGLVAFWGGKVDQGNLDQVRGAKPPFRVTCEAFKPDSTKYDLWVPQRPRITSLEELSTPQPAASPAIEKRISIADLEKWRGYVIQILGSLDAQPAINPPEGLAARINRLTWEGRVPREMAPLMRTVTEMRNTSLYEQKVLSATESAAVSGAWSAVSEWALAHGLGPFD